MIIVPESIKRILDRTIEIYSRDLKNHRSYYSSIKINGRYYTGTNTTKILLKLLKDFKAKLENGTSQLLVCEKGKEDEAKIQLMYSVLEHLEPLSNYDKAYIMHDVYIQEGLVERVEALSKKIKTQQEASGLLDFLNDAYNSSWGQDDEIYRVRDFRLVTSEEEFEYILTTVKNVEEITDKPFFTTMRIALVTMNYYSLYKEKGILEEYQSFLETHKDDDDFDGAIDMFNMWHDVRETAIYYIYAPAVPK